MNLKINIIVSFCLLAFLSCQSKKTNSTETSNAPAEQEASIQDIEVAEIDKVLAAHPDIVLLDVRTSEEHSEGAIPNSSNIDFYGSEFSDKITALDRDKSYLVYCRSGGRSGKTAKLMEQLEFKSVFNLLGGYTAYTAR